MKRGWITIMITAMLATSNPATAENDLPPTGRSRFDQLIGHAPVPYPFSRLADKINAQMLPEPGGLPPLKVTLIPLGRSLQRDAGAPDFFRFPRVVAAADGNNRPGIAPLKDRLFLGFHEKGEVIEVISYNDAAGRFEFQVVRDYARGKTPQVFYARRGLCLACHQNAAPIFARPLWDETPANPAIAVRLKAARRDFYKVKLTGTDIAYFIDAATDRANMVSIWQTLWQLGCGADTVGARCRRDAFAAALDFARNGSLPRPDSLPALAVRWKARWPTGLSIPNPDLQNRDPLAHLQDAANDPLLLRPPLATWHAPDINAFVVGLAGLLDLAAVRALPRDSDQALDRMLAIGRFDARPYSLALLDDLRRELGQPRPRAPQQLPPARVEPAPVVEARSPLVAPFRTHCASCHDTTLPHPPNFLHGTPAEVEARINHCAERIFVRLNRIHAPAAAPGVAAMPPAAALVARGIEPARWAASPELAALTRAIEARLPGGDPRRLLRRPYANLRACLPDYRAATSPVRPDHVPTF
jgi:mono/diheme cytochrome c family protein